MPGEATTMSMRRSNSTSRDAAVLMLVLALAGCIATQFCQAFTVPPSSRICREALDVRLSSEIDQEAQRRRQELLDKASQLRKEAGELESKLREHGGQPNVSREPEKFVEPVPSYSDIKDSVWTLSYRFSDQPESEDEEVKRRFYSGKLQLKFRQDGYTDLIVHEPGASNKSLEVLKAWGWDVETSNEDEDDYLLFSIDFALPAPDGPSKQRFYFQARQESDKNTFSLEEGKVTMKQDILDGKVRPGLWGLSATKGILAQFRNVGVFIAKPSRV